MTDPYETLGLERGCSDAEIRRRYLELVRQHPPDREPDRFAIIREAYDQLRDPVKRLKAKLFPLKTTDSMDAIILDVQNRLRTARIPLETLLSLAERA